MILYNDRVFCYERLAALEPVIRRQSPDDATLNEFVELDIRNQLGFMELESYQRSGRFLCRHPLTESRQQFNELEVLRKNNPERFAQELVCCTRNITRYNSQLKNKRYTNKKEKTKWLQAVKSFSEKKKIMEQLLAGK
jgi:hypothetical protein